MKNEKYLISAATALTVAFMAYKLLNNNSDSNNSKPKTQEKSLPQNPQQPITQALESDFKKQDTKVKITKPESVAVKWNAAKEIMLRHKIKEKNARRLWKRAQKNKIAMNLH